LKRSSSDARYGGLAVATFYQVGKTYNNFMTLPGGPIKTFTLRGIKESPPYLASGAPTRSWRDRACRRRTRRTIPTASSPSWQQPEEWPKSNSPKPRCPRTLRRIIWKSKSGWLGRRCLRRAYIKNHIADHQKTALRLEWEINSGEGVQLQRFAAETLPKVLSHLEAAQTIHAELTGAAIR
jgi:hypothetical protein